MTHTDQHGSGGPGYEKRDIRATAVYLYGGLLLVLIVLSMAFIDWLFDTMKSQWDADQSPPAAILRLSEPLSPPQPAFAMYPARSLAEFRRAEDRYMRSYGWVDREAGVGRIPVERAMDLLLQQGLPAVPPTESAEESTP